MKTIRLMKQIKVHEGKENPSSNVSITSEIEVSNEGEDFEVIAEEAQKILDKKLAEQIEENLALLNALNGN